MDEPVVGFRARPAPPDWDRVERALNRLAEFADHQDADESFYSELLTQLLRFSCADRASIWAWSHDGRLDILNSREGPQATASDMDHAARQRRATVAIETGEIQSAEDPTQVEATEDTSRVPGNEVPPNHTAFWLPIDSTLQYVARPAVVEITVAIDSAAALPAWLDKLIRAFEPIATDFADRHELVRLQRDQAGSEHRERFLRRLYHAEGTIQFAYLLANEGRQIFSCDRASVLVQKSGSLRLLAVSGVDTVDRRAPLTQCLQRLATAVATSGEDLHLAADESSAAPARSPQVEQALADYLEQSPARRLTVALLRGMTSVELDSVSQAEDASRERGPPAVSGALVLEDFRITNQSTANTIRLENLRPHCEIALAQRVKQEQRPLYWLSGQLQKWSRPVSRYRLAVATLVIILVLAGLFGLKAPMTISARGRLEASQRQDIFARSDGVVRELHVAHGDRVERGQLLVIMEDPVLELRASEISGELRTARQQLQTIQSKRLNQARSERERDDELQLAAQQQQLKAKIGGLEKQHWILRKQLEELTVRSPIDGTVLTWDLARNLGNRPLQRGHRMMTVAPSDADWKLQLSVRDRDIAHLVDYQQRVDVVPVSFLLMTDSRHAYEAVVTDVSLVTEWNDQPHVRVMARVAGDQGIDSRTGATVVAKISCGQRSLAFLWLHELYATLRTWWF